MNADVILSTFDRHGVDAILIGGMNFLLRHQPVLTFDIDFWINDTDANLVKVNRALHDLGAEWGKSESDWASVPDDPAWLRRQSVFCVTTKHGAVDIFRKVRGLDGQYEPCISRAILSRTVSGIPYLALSDQDMLACQMALPEAERRLDRVAYLQNYLKTQS